MPHTTIVICIRKVVAVFFNCELRNSLFDITQSSTYLHLKVFEVDIKVFEVDIKVFEVDIKCIVYHYIYSTTSI